MPDDLNHQSLDNQSLDNQSLDNQSLDNQSLDNQSLDNLWGSDVRLAICEACDWSYLLPGSGGTPHCPHCYQAVLTELETGFEELPYQQPPELILPFSVSEADVKARIQAFAKKIPLPPADLTPEALTLRLQKLYLPRWLVDGEVQAIWQAEVGFDYEVVSHQDQFDQKQGGWISNEVRETRIRWEPRVGRLNRTYHNIDAPAMEDEADMRRRLGNYDVQPSQPYQPPDLIGSVVRLPNRPPSDAWSDAEPHFQEAAAQECLQATSSDHIREFRWSAQFGHQNWTQLLLPVYTTYYLDDDRQPQYVLLHGQSGRVSGSRRASMKRAKRNALIIAVVAVVMFLCSGAVALGAFWEDEFLGAAGIGVLLALLVGLGALAPIVIVWGFNLQQE